MERLTDSSVSPAAGMGLSRIHFSPVILQKWCVSSLALLLKQMLLLRCSSDNIQAFGAGAGGKGEAPALTTEKVFTPCFWTKHD